MTNLRSGLITVAVSLLLVGCIGENERSQEYMIDQDIDASHGGSVPSLNQGASGFEIWRHRDPDTFGYSQGRW